MRILVVSCTGIAAERPLQWMVEAGHEVFLLGDGDFYPTDPPPNYHYFPSLWRTEIEAKPSSSPDEIWMAKAMAPKIRELIDQLQPDLIHVNAIGWHSYSCALAGARPLLVSAWGFLNYLLSGEVEEEQLERTNYVLDRTDVLIVETPQLIDKPKAFLQPTAKIELIPLGAKTQLFRQGVTRDIARWKRDLLHIPEDTSVLLSPRGFAKIYCHEEIFQAYGLAYAKFTKPTALVFLSMGRGSYEEGLALRNSIISQAEALNLRDRIHWIPHFPHLWMPTIYNLADVVINYPYTDAFPSTLIEAVACECPIISCELPAYQDTFITKFCTLVAPQDPAALAEAMIEVVNQPPAARRDRLAQARQLIVEQFDEANLQQRFLKACETVCKKVS